MVIPWLGFSLSELLNKVQIKSSAKFVEFETVYNPEEMVGQRYPVLNWPYIEGLRLDEAMHPLTTVVTGLYGKSLPNQNGAPLRIFIPWKYGFKSAKAIVNDGLKKTGRWFNSHPISSFANLELKNSEPSNSKKYHYNGLATNIIINYVIHKTNKDFQKLLNEIFQKKARVENSVFFMKQKGVPDELGPVSV